MLYEYQKEVLENSQKNYLYALDTGTGKTLIALHHYYKYAAGKQLIIIAPAAKVKEKGWEREINAFIKYYNISEIKYQIVSYQSIHKLDITDPENTFMILDECHYIKNYKAKRSKEVLKLSKKIYGFVGLSATPASNGWIDTINYFLMFDLYSNSTEFLRNHAIYELMNFGKVKVNQVVGWKDEEYLKILFDSISSKALKKEDCLDLPNIGYENVFFKQSKDYKTIKKDRVFNDVIYDTVGKLMAGLRLNGNLKDKIDYLKMLAESTTENIVIFYNFQAEYDLIRQELLKNKIYIDFEVRGGSTRIPWKDDFKNIKNTITAVQIQAGGTGIELTYASLVIFFSPTWSYQDYEQALGRSHRNGQDKKVTVYKFIVEKTIDENVYAALENKKDFTEKLFLREVEAKKEIGGTENMSDITDEIEENLAAEAAHEIVKALNENKTEPGENVTKNRHKYVGGSDLPALLNISAYKTQYELALEKAGIRPTEFKGNEYTRYGQLLEPLIRDYINNAYGTNFKEDTNTNEEHHIRSNCDGLDKEQELLLEVKTNNGKKEDLTEYIVQIQLYLHQFGIENCYLAQYTRPSDFYSGIDYGVHNADEYFNVNFDPDSLEVSLVEKDEKLTTHILKEIELFWQRVDWLKANPAATEGEYYTCMKIGVYDQKFYLKTMTNVEKLEAKLEKMEETKAKLKQEKEILFAIMDTFNFNSIKTDKMTISKVDATVKQTFDTTTFKKEHPDIYEGYLKESEVKGYVKITKTKEEAPKTKPRKITDKKIEDAVEIKEDKVKETTGESIEFGNKMTRWLSAKNKKINTLTNTLYSMWRPENNIIRVVQNQNKDTCVLDFSFNKTDMSVKLQDDSNFDKTIPANFEDYNNIIKAMPAWVTFEEDKSPT